MSEFLATIPLPFALVVILAGLAGGETAADDPFSHTGPYAVGRRTLAVNRSDGTQFDMLLYHPADADGVNVPLAAGNDLFPAISFGPGFLQPNREYESTLRHLASWGYFVGSTESQLSFAPNKPQYAQDLSDMLTVLEVSNADSASDFSGRVAVDRFGVAGHSLGGGVSVLTAVGDPRVKAVANFAAASTNAPPPFPPGLPPTDDPSAIDLAADLNVPVSFISGSQDSIVPVADHGQLMYNNARAPKLLPNIVGGFHCGFVENDSSFFCDSGSITGQQQRAIARAELTSFFEVYLGQNDEAWKRVWGPERQTAPGLDTQLDAGFLLVASDPLAAIAPGESGQITFTLTNISLNEQTFDLFAEDGAWDALLSIDSTPALAPSESVQFRLTINVPADSNLQTDQFMVSGRSGIDGGTRSYALVTVVAIPEPSSLLPIALFRVALARRRKPTRWRGRRELCQRIGSRSARD